MDLRSSARSAVVDCTRMSVAPCRKGVNGSAGSALNRAMPVGWFLPAGTWATPPACFGPGSLNHTLAGMRCPRWQV